MVVIVNPKLAISHVLSILKGCELFLSLEFKPFCNDLGDHQTYICLVVFFVLSYLSSMIKADFAGAEIFVRLP